LGVILYVAFIKLILYYDCYQTFNKILIFKKKFSMFSKQVSKILNSLINVLIKLIYVISI